jgi:excinuclease ABC subunit A
LQVQSQTIAEIKNQINNKSKEEDKIIILSPIVQNQKGEFKEMLNDLLKKGFLRVIIDKKLTNLDDLEQTQNRQKQKT